MEAFGQCAPCPFTLIHQHPTSCLLFSLFYPLCMDSYFIKWIIIHSFRFSDWPRFGQWEPFQAGSFVLLSYLYPFFVSTSFLSVQHHIPDSSLPTFLAPALASATSPRSPGSFQLGAIFRNQDRVLGVLAVNWGVIAFRI